MAIILDTSVLPRTGVLRHVIASAVLKVADHRGMLVCIPSVVAEESVNARREAVVDITKKITAVFREAAKLFDIDGVYIPDAEEVADDWRRELSSSFMILDLHPDDAVEALRREANRVPPAKVGKGARDCAIWLTAVRHHRSNEGPTYFVSANTDDFGKASLQSRLAEDLGDRSDDFHYIKSLGSLLGVLASEFPFEATADLVAAIEEEALRRVYSSYELASGAPIAFNPATGDFDDSPLTLEFRPQHHRALKSYDVEGTWFTLIELDWLIRYGGTDLGMTDLPITVRLWAQLGSVSGPITTFNIDSVTVAGTPASERPPTYPS